MKISNKDKILYGLLVLTSSLCVYLFFSDNTQNDSAIQSKTEYKDRPTVEVNSLQNEIDSLIQDGLYTSALDRVNSSGDILNADEKEYTVLLLDKIISLQNRINDQELVSKLDQPDTTTIRREITPRELRAYDSMVFALRKSQIYTKNLERQLTEKASFEYLKFETTKGNEVFYVGQVQDDQANGRGVALLSTGSRYEGQWKENKRHGYGVFHWPDGERYEGEYKEDERHGEGTYFWPNGEKYVGGWANNHRNGKGVFYAEDGSVRASGTWRNDELIEIVKK